MPTREDDISPVDAGYRRGKGRAGWLARLLAALLVAGCAVGADFHSPTAPGIDRCTEGETPSATVGAATTGGAQQRLDVGRDIAGDWWTLFRSPRLTALVEQALRANPDLAAAQATLLEAEDNLRAGQAQYRAGAVPYTSVLQAEQTYQSARLTLVNAQAARFMDTVTLYQALGGGWWNRSDVDPGVAKCCGILP